MIAPQFSANLVQPSANRSLPNMVGEVLPVISDSLPRGQPVNLTTVRHLLPQTVSTLTPRQLMEVMPFLNASQWMAISSNQVSGLPESLRAQVLLRQGRSRELMQMSNMQIALLPLTTVAANLRLFSYDQLLSLTSQQVQALSPLQQTERLEMIRKALR